MHILGRNADKERLHGLMLTSPMMERMSAVEEAPARKLRPPVGMGLVLAKSTVTWSSPA